MGKHKISEEQKEKAWKLFQEGNSIHSVSRILGISYLSAWIFTSGRQKGFGSYSAYSEYTVRRKGFRNCREYKKFLAFLKKSFSGRFSNHQIEQQSFEQSLVFLPLETIKSFEEQGLARHVSFYRPSVDDYPNQLEGLSLEHADIHEALCSLSALEQEIIEKFYSGQTLDEIQKNYSMHHETIRTIKDKGIMKLRNYLIKKIHERIT
ncbi:hypothetical protein J4221_03005 [Candidatus Pacearchaeota archaeon]|nr:hypothetical protein [Candidatus Pacearchaeota archaeon]